MKRIIDKIVYIDEKVIYYFMEKDNKIVTNFMKILTYLANKGVYGIFIALYLYFILGLRDEVYLLLAAMIINTLMVNLCIKNIVKRVRPYDKLKDVHSDINKPKDYSFPSGHTSITTVVNLMLIYNFYYIGSWFIVFNIVFIVLMACSRLYLKVHYLSDVITGFIIGCINILIVIYFKTYVCNIGSFFSELIKM